MFKKYNYFNQLKSFSTHNKYILITNTFIKYIVYGFSLFINLNQFHYNIKYNNYLNYSFGQSHYFI
jgi:hypothetical protein